jgi:hypothetical protein
VPSERTGERRGAFLRALNRLEAHRWPVLLVTLLSYWAVGFYPYQIGPYQNAAVLTAEQTLRFDAPGIAYSRGPPAWLPAAIGSSSLHVTLEVRTAPNQIRRWARILSLSQDSHSYNLFIAKDGRRLVVQLGPFESDVADRPRYVVDNVFALPGWRRIELDISPSLLSIKVDGREALREAVPPQLLANWSPKYRLAFGNEFGFSRPWLGELREATVLVAGQRHDYLLPEALKIPARHHPPLAFRYIQWTPFPAYNGGSRVNSDHAVNFFGFIPLGWILAMTLRRPKSLLALAAMGCAMSLSIEAGQILLAQRTPSVDDLLLNTLGGALGAWLGLRVRGWWRRGATALAPQ